MKKLFVLGVICLLCTISAVSQSKRDWEKVQSLNTWNVYQQFLLNYPNGKYTELARQKQALLKQPEPVKKVETKKTEVPVEKSIIAAPTVITKNDGQILIKKGRYYVDEKPINGKELKRLLKSDPESSVDFKKSRTTVTIGYVLDGATAFVLAASVGILPAVLGGVLVATPFIIVSNKQLKKSIDIYNSKHTATGYRSDLKLDIGLTRNSVGVTCYF